MYCSHTFTFQHFLAMMLIAMIELSAFQGGEVETCHVLVSEPNSSLVTAGVALKTTGQKTTDVITSAYLCYVFTHLLHMKEYFSGISVSFCFVEDYGFFSPQQTSIKNLTQRVNYKQRPGVLCHIYIYIYIKLFFNKADTFCIYIYLYFFSLRIFWSK